MAGPKNPDRQPDGRFSLKHGQSGNPERGRSSSPEYKSWAAMKSRCNNPNATDYYRYGGRGIKVCERWDRSFSAFLEDMGQRPTVKHCLDRIDNDLGYFAENCRWSTQKIQQRNRSGNRLFELDGQILTLAEVAEHAGVSIDVICHRMRGGWSPDELLTPLRSPRISRGGRLRHIGVRGRST